MPRRTEDASHQQVPVPRRRARGRGSTAGEDPALLLITRDAELTDDVALIAAVVGVKLQTQRSWEEGHDDGDYAAVLCSPECPPPTAREAAGALLVGGRDAALWDCAAAHPGLTPVPLPEAERWLSETLSARVLDRSAGGVLAVTGGCGGVGVTTCAYLLAAELAVRGRSPLLVDADPGPGSGVRDVVRSCRGSGALTGGDLDWERLSRVSGELSASHLHSGLPMMDGIGVLTAETPAVAPGGGLLAAAVEAGRRVFEVVVIDLGARWQLLHAVRESLDEALVVLRPSRRGVDAAGELLTVLGPVRSHLLLSGRATAGWSGVEAAESLSLPVAGVLPEQRWLAKADDLNESYELLRSRRGAALISQVVDALPVLRSSSTGESDV